MCPNCNGARHELLERHCSLQTGTCCEIRVRCAYSDDELALEEEEEEEEESHL